MIRHCSRQDVPVCVNQNKQIFKKSKSIRLLPSARKDSLQLKNFLELDVDELGQVVLEEVEKRFVDVFSRHGDLDGRLGRVHLLQDDAEADGLIASVTFPMNFAVRILK